MSETERRNGYIDMQRQIDELHFVLFRNGFTANVKKLADTMERLDGRVANVEKGLNDHIITREITCPVKEQRKGRKKDRVLAFGLIFTGTGTTIAIATLVLKLAGAL